MAKMSKRERRREEVGRRLTVEEPLDVLYDPRGPVTVDPEVRETTAQEYEQARKGGQKK